MNCARVLQAFGSHPQPAMMPLDLAKYLSLSRRQPLHQLLSMAPLKPTQHHHQPTDSLPRSGLHSPHPSSSSFPFSPSSGLRSCFRKDSSGLSKKRVVFADAKGLSLTAVRLFISEPSAPASTLVMKPSVAKLQSQQQSASNKLQRYKWRLGFPQPMLDLKAFVERLQEMRVQLESCNVSKRCLSGKVRVSHDSIDKAVHVRVTFDSWRSHSDILCTFLQQQHYRGSNMDIFAFDLSLPKTIDPKERVEFCVSFRPGPGATPHWDDNRGLNYRVCVEKDGTNGYQGDAYRCYPTLDRPSNVPLGTQTYAELQYLQRGIRA